MAIVLMALAVDARRLTANSESVVVGTKDKMHAQGLRMPMFPAYRTQARPVVAGAT